VEYKVYEPAKELQPFIKCFWSLEATASPVAEKQRIVPDGCMEMIFHCGDLYEQFLDDGKTILQPRSFVFGQITRPLEIAPTGASNMPLPEMENKAVSLNSLFNKEGLQLEKQVLGASTTAKRITIIETFLLNKLSSPEVTDRVAKQSVETLIKLKGQLSVDDLAAQLKINRRQLERKFSSAIGLSPKQLAKVIRLQATLKMLEKRQFTSLTSLAYENGYFDQAHFIKDFKEFTGMSPGQFYTGNLKMSALFASE
jgi:AraC-like DNA-binding protein